MENMRLELEDKLRKVEEDRHTVEMYSGMKIFIQYCPTMFASLHYSIF